MPGFEGGQMGRAESAWAKDIGSEENYNTQWENAENQLKLFVEKLNANTSMIPMEDYDIYLAAANFYQEVAQMHPGDVDKRLAIAAKNIIAESPL